jgi:hypothetical protein
MTKGKKLPEFTEKEMKVELNKTEEKEFENGKKDKQK